MTKQESDTRKHVERFETSGPVDYYVCAICKGRVNPFYFEYHLKSKRPEVH